MYKNMNSIAEKIKQKEKTIYQILAEKYNTTNDYIGLIARGDRVPKRGKGLEIKKELEKLADNSNE